MITRAARGPSPSTTTGFQPHLNIHIGSTGFMICYNSGRPGHFKYCIYWHRRNWIGRRDGWRPWAFVRAVICLPRGWLVLWPAAGVALDILCALPPQHRCFLLLSAIILTVEHCIPNCVALLRHCLSSKATNISNLLWNTYSGVFKLHTFQEKCYISPFFHINVIYYI